MAAGHCGATVLSVYVLSTRLEDDDIEQRVDYLLFTKLLNRRYSLYTNAAYDDPYIYQGGADRRRTPLLLPRQAGIDGK